MSNKALATVVVADPRGLHAWPLFRCFQATWYTDTLVSVTACGQTIHGNPFYRFPFPDTLRLGIPCGAAVRIEVTGDEADVVAEQIIRIIKGEGNHTRRDRGKAERAQREAVPVWQRALLQSANDTLNDSSWREAWWK